MRHRRASAPPPAPEVPEPKKEERIGAVVVSWQGTGNEFAASTSRRKGVIRLDLDGREVPALYSGGAQLHRHLRPSREGQRVIAWRDSKTRWRAQLAEPERVDPVPGSATPKARTSAKPVPSLLVPVLRASLAGGASVRAVAEYWNLSIEQVVACAT